MTFDEKVIKKLQDRSLALTQKVSIETNELNLEAERDFNYQYLFGDGVHIGINNLISLYYQELHSTVGRETSTPSLRLDILTSWANRLEQAITLAGDRSISSPVSDAIYPDPANNGVAVQDLNVNSSWFNNNGDDGNQTGGIVGNIISLQANGVGVNATQTGNGRGPFSTQSEAEAHRDATRGSGLRGRRTENSEVYQYLIDSLWYVGQSGTDNPHYYNAPERTSLLNGLSGLISNLEDGGTVQTLLDNIQTELEDIENGDNVLFSEAGANIDPDIESQLLTDINEIPTYKDVLDTTVGDSADPITSTTLWGYYNYFNQFTAGNNISAQSGYNQTTFNNNLSSLYSFLSPLISVLQSRSSSIPAKLGSRTEGLKKWRFFWLKENIEKPVSPLVSLNGIEGAKTSNAKNINNANDSLEILFPNQQERWILVPQLFAAYYNPVRDKETFEPIIEINELIWSGQPHASKYVIYRKELEDVSEFEDNWVDGIIDDWDIKNEETGFVLTTYQDIGTDPSKTYVYRVQTFDEENDPSNPITSSLQSRLYSIQTAADAQDIVDGVVTFSDIHDFSVGQFVYIQDTGIYRIEFVSNTTITLEDISIQSVDSVTVFVAQSVVPASV